MKGYAIASIGFAGDRRASIPALLLAVLAAFVAAGCGPKRAASQGDALNAPTGRASTALKREGLELEAYAKGNTVHLSLANHYPFPVVAGPKSFGIIDTKKRSVMPFRMGFDWAQLPAKRLAQGEGIQGELTFRALGDLTGNRLVFNCDEAAPVFCTIESIDEAGWPGFSSPSKTQPMQ